MKIGILGGRFDPPHLGHLKAAEMAKARYGLDKVWFIPCNRGNLRSKIAASAKDRVEMLKLLLNKKFKISEIDINRGGITYTIDTIRDLKKQYSDHQFFFIIGEELVSELPKWKDWEKLKREIEFLKVKNIGFGKILKISSSIIKERMKKGLAIGKMAGEEVEAYIYNNRLYK